ncbi:MAG: hypothetical protein GXP05_11960 [Alphaproteobacteria bacterium]|nr:hypothetical protein [Alphaproteobacteria bacterium]
MLVIVDDRLWRSIARDTYTYGLLLALTGIGYVLGISALTWIRGIIWMIAIVSKVSGLHKGHVTISEAREYLDKLEGGK